MFNLEWDLLRQLNRLQTIGLTWSKRDRRRIAGLTMSEQALPCRIIAVSVSPLCSAQKTQFNQHPNGS